MNLSPNANRRVLLFECSLSAAACRAYDAIRRASIGFGWDLQPIEYAIIDDHIRSRPFVPTPDNIATLLDLWQPSGIIIECAGRAPQLPLDAFGRLPIVLLDCHQTLCTSKRICIHSDESEIARVAARELLSLGLPEYAYLPYPQDTVWSRLRGDAFNNLIVTSGRHCHRLKTTDTDNCSLMQALCNQVKAIPKPCGIFAANDEIARLLISACEYGGMAIPDDVSILGVDNDERFCENANTTLSSVAIDFDTVGTMAAESINELMNHRGGNRNPKACDAIRLVRRMSTYRLKTLDTRISRAKEIIRLRACYGLTATDVAHEIGCSRRFADARFVEATGLTVQETILQQQLENVKLLLEDHKTELTSIPHRCGFNSMSNLCRVFKKKTGLTLTEWRKDSRRLRP